MSVIRICDCPEGCHDYDRPRHMGPGEFMEIAGLQVCNECLDGEFGCRYWQPYVRPPMSALEKQMMDIWGPIIRNQLEAGTRLRDWDRYTQNRITWTEFKKRRESNGTNQK